MSIDTSTGRISGKPWQVGALRITATATDTGGTTATASFPLTVNWF
ncbi:putative Ig domain-containing protein [Streptomyces sp. NBC_00322]|nr:putative Ig domain-containing protein [Streptomyces sp. NBC_00322]